MSAHSSSKVRHYGNHKARKTYVDPFSRKALGEANAIAEKHVVTGEPTRLRQHARNFQYGKADQ